MNAPSQLRLRACHAARKFVRRRASRSRRCPWRPIALRWRRGPAVATSGREAMRGRVGMDAMQMHVHLSFAHPAIAMGGMRAPPASRVSAPARFAMREVETAPAPSLSSHMARAHANVVQTHRVIQAYRVPVIGRASSPVASQRPRPTAMQPDAGTRVAAALRAQAVPPLAPLRRAGASPSRYGDMNPHAVAPRTTALRAIPRAAPAMHGATPSAPVSPHAMVRQPELVWRAPAAASTAPDARPVATARTPSAAIDATSPRPASAGIEAPVDAARVHAAVRAQVLDPALAERLADDVIRRIEHRARIERERRGL